MSNVDLVMTRIDERLLHGQGQLWLRYLGANTVIVANDAVSKDPLQQMLMQTVVGKEVALRFFSIQKVIDVIHKASAKQHIFLVIKDCQDALKLVQGGVPITEINLGNIHNAPGKEMITRSLYLGEQDKQSLRELHTVYHIKFNTKTTPQGNDGAAEVDITKFI